MLSTPPLLSCRSCCMACCSSASPRRTPGSSSAPSALSAMARALRRDSGTRRDCSSVRICMLTAAGVTCRASAASAKLRWVATASNTRSALSGSRSKLRAASVFLVCRSDIAFAAGAREAKTTHHWKHTRSSPMSTKVVALFAALLLTTAEYLVFEYDAQQRVVQYRAEISRVAEHG